MSETSGADKFLAMWQPGTDVAINRLRDFGFNPTAIIDVGAYEGGFGEGASVAWPEARVVFVEANAAMIPKLEVIKEDFIGPEKCDIVHALVLDKEYDSVRFYQMDGGSGVFYELTDFRRNELRLPATTLEKALAPLNLPPGPWFVKLDIQGAEVPALCGLGAQNWKHVEVVYMEVATIEYNKGAPLFADVVAYMRAQDMLLFDIGSIWSRETDKVMFQVDLVFVKKDSALRAQKKVWKNEQ